MWRVGPGLSEFLALAILLGRWDIVQAEILRDMLGNQRVYAARRNLQAVLEQTMQQHAPAIMLYAFGVAAGLEVDSDRVDAMHLLIGIAATITHRDHQH